MIDTITWWLEVVNGYLDLGLYAKLNPHLNPWVEMLVVDYLILIRSMVPRIQRSVLESVLT